jgi:GNAT superfamily N-acetyltransferase
MNNVFKFEPVTKYKRGVIFSLLQQSFAGLWNDDLEKKTRQYDQDIFDNPDTVGACVFITCLNSNAIGMASWDPRQGPEMAILGYNCILPEYQGKGFGTSQIKEVLGQLKTAGFKKAIVTTGQHPFFAAAVKMYLACGFKEQTRYNKGKESRYGSVDYEVEL